MEQSMEKLKETEGSEECSTLLSFEYDKVAKNMNREQF